MSDGSAARQRTVLDWQVGFSTSAEIAPERFVPATVPGAVQLDWARATGMPDHNYADHFKQYAWMEDTFWHYRAELPPAVESDVQRLFFVCGGVDYHYVVRVGGKVLFEREGMFAPFEIDVTAYAGQAIELIVRPAPKSVDSPVDRSQANRSCKPAVSYGWDWHPRLVPLGIWRETFVERRPAAHLVDADVRYTLSDDLSSAEVRCAITTAGAEPGRRVRWRLIDPNDKVVFDISDGLSADALRARVDQPQLWWPAGEGAQGMYRSVVELLDDTGDVADQRDARIGFRRVRLVMAPDQWEYPDFFPKPRSRPPITLEINGRPIFCRGTNWVNPEIFPGTITRDKYASLLRLARGANFNLLRIWGGGIVNTPDFFELCDELGIMVWQEFPLACNNYPDDADYLRVLDAESKAIVSRLRRHPSLAIWCGGNELFNAWSGMTDQSKALRLLNRNCYDLDPNTPFLPTSPIDGMAHGNYVFRYDDGSEVFQAMPKASYTAYTEFGCAGPSPVEVLKSFIPEDELFPPRRGTAWETHHAFGAWRATDWLNVPTLEHYFGPIESLEQLVERGEWLQCEGYKCIYEESRRQKPACSMALNWCFNEPWPTAANNSLVSYPDKPKPAYHAVAAACRMTMASARIPKFQWKPGDVFEAEAWLLHDGPDAPPGVTIDVVLRLDDEDRTLATWTTGDIQPNAHQQGPTARLKLPAIASDRIVLSLQVRDQPAWTSAYVLSFKPNRAVAPSGTRTMNL